MIESVVLEFLGAEICDVLLAAAVAYEQKQGEKAEYRECAERLRRHESYFERDVKYEVVIRKAEVRLLPRR